MYLSSSIEGPQKLCLKKKPTKWCLSASIGLPLFFPICFLPFNPFSKNKLREPLFGDLSPIPNPCILIGLHHISMQPFHQRRYSTRTDNGRLEESRYQPCRGKVEQVRFKDVQGEHVVAFGNSFDGFCGDLECKTSQPWKVTFDDTYRFGLRQPSHHLIMTW